MPITATHLVTSGSTTDAASFSTASITPSANKLILVSIINTHGSSASTPILSGNGLTWIQINTFLSGNGLTRITTFRAMGASPSAGAITINFGGVTQTGCLWSVSEFDGVDTTGTNGSGAVVQSVSGEKNPDIYSFALTLAPFGNANNAAYGAFSATNGTMSAGTGFTILGSSTITVPDTAIATEWVSTQHTTVDVSYSPANTFRVVGIALEIKQAAATPVSKAVTAALEAVSGRSSSASTNEEAVGFINKMALKNLEGLASLAKTSNQLFENATQALKSSTVNLEGLASILKTAIATIEAAGVVQTAVSATALMRLESIAAVVRSIAGAIESVGIASKIANLEIENSRETAFAAELKTETLSYVVHGGLGQIEALGILAQSSFGNLEALTSIFKSSSMPVAYMQLVIRGISGQAEVISPVVLVSKANVEALGVAIRTGTLTTEVLEVILSSSSIPIDAIVGIILGIATNEVAVEALFAPRLNRGAVFTRSLNLGADFANGNTISAFFTRSKDIESSFVRSKNIDAEF